LLGAQDSLESITTTTLPDGALCWVTDEEARYVLHRASSAAPSPPTVIAPAIGPGRWEIDNAVESAEPFRGTYFVDPAFVGVHTGSESNPFTTIAAAFAAGVALGLAGGIVFIPPDVAVVENVVFPLLGNWEIASQMQLGFNTAGITGNVDVSCSTTARRALTNLRVTGNVSGNVASGVNSSRLMLTNTFITGTLTLTGTGTSFWRCSARSAPIEGPAGGPATGGGAISGAVSIAGSWYSFNYNLFVSLSFTQGSQFGFGTLPPQVTSNGSGTVLLWLNGISNTVGSPLTFTAASGALQVRPDGGSLAELLRVTMLTVGSVICISENSNNRFRLTLTNNSGPNALAARTAESLMVCEATLTLLANDPAAAGNAVLSVTYTGLSGALQTKVVTTTPLNVAGAIGDEVSGVLPFSQNGATAITFTVSGITNNTGLQYSAGVAVRQAT
jgi:hypothetical protein